MQRYKVCFQIVRSPQHFSSTGSDGGVLVWHASTLLVSTTLMQSRCLATEQLVVPAPLMSASRPAKSHMTDLCQLFASMLFCCRPLPWRTGTVQGIVAGEVSIESCGYLSGDDCMRLCPNMLQTYCLPEG